MGALAVLGRLAAIIDATIIQADPATAAEAVQLAEQSQGVWLRQSNDHGIKDIHIRTQTPAAIWFDASIQRLADSLEAFGDTTTEDVRRATAVGILAQPQQALDMFAKTAATAATAEAAAAVDKDTEVAAQPDQQPPTPRGTGVDARPPATLYIHLSQDSFTRDDTGVARFEGEGPLTVDQVRSWLGHCNVTVKPVIDLPNQAPVDGYEVPDRLREATHLRSPVDIFPYATNTG